LNYKNEFNLNSIQFNQNHLSFNSAMFFMLFSGFNEFSLVAVTYFGLSYVFAPSHITLLPPSKNE
jgi:hypothetical protein